MMWWYVPLGFFVGTVGTLVGAGGGFLLIPILLFLKPEAPPEQLTGISLAVIFLNATSGTIAYHLKGRVDWHAMRAFTVAAIPGAILGAYATYFISRARFNVLFGVLMIVVSTYLFFKKAPPHGPVEPNPKYPRRILTESNGTVHVLSYSPVGGQILSFLTGFVSSLVGIGGGIIHVPALVRLLRFPVHLATATSHSVLAVTALCGLLVHIISGGMNGSWMYVLYLAPGLIIGAQIGARLSDRFGGNAILRVLAVALFSVGARLLF